MQSFGNGPAIHFSSIPETSRITLDLASVHPLVYIEQKGVGSLRMPTPPEMVSSAKRENDFWNHIKTAPPSAPYNPTLFGTRPPCATTSSRTEEGSSNFEKRSRDPRASRGHRIPCFSKAEPWFSLYSDRPLIIHERSSIRIGALATAKKLNKKKPEKVKKISNHNRHVLPRRNRSHFRGDCSSRP